MTTITTLNMIGILVCFGAIMFLLVWWQRKKGDTIEDFTVAGRNVGLGFGSATLLATWIWALSLYAPAQSGYQYGISGPLAIREDLIIHYFRRK